MFASYSLINTAIGIMSFVGAISDRPNSGEHCSPLHYPKLSRIIKQWKGVVTKKVGFPIWQKSFYDHIIRHEEDYHMVVGYIENNPKKLEMYIEEREKGE